MPRDKNWKCPWQGCTHHDVSARNLRHHWEINHDPVRAPSSEFMCSIPGCNKRFKIERSLERHLEAGHGATVAIQCPYDWCKFSPTRGDNLKTHISTQHSGPHGRRIPPRIRERATAIALSAANRACKSQRVNSLEGALDAIQSKILSLAPIDAETQSSLDKCDTPTADAETSSPGSAPGSSIRDPIADNSPPESSIKDPMDVDSSDNEEIHTLPEPDVSTTVGRFSCICGYPGPSGRLLLCRGCLRYQHQQCYYPLCPKGPIQLGTEHYCLECAPWRGPGFHRETQRTLSPQGQVRCICGLSDFDGMMITCVQYRRFQHQSCCLPELRAGDLFPHLAYFCVDCIGHPDPALRADNLDLLRRHQRALDKARRAPGNRPMLDSVPSLAYCLKTPRILGGLPPAPTASGEVRISNLWNLICCQFRERRITAMSRWPSWITFRTRQQRVRIEP